MGRRTLLDALQLLVEPGNEPGPFSTWTSRWIPRSGGTSLSRQAMPVWPNAPVVEQPEFVLVSWEVHEVQLRPGGEVTQHVAGEVGYGGAGQVSSAIIHFDPAVAAFRTRSGRCTECAEPTGSARRRAPCGASGFRGIQVICRFATSPGRSSRRSRQRMDSGPMRR